MLLIAHCNKNAHASFGFLSMIDISPRKNILCENSFTNRAHINLFLLQKMGAATISNKCISYDGGVILSSSFSWNQFQQQKRNLHGFGHNRNEIQ